MYPNSSAHTANRIPCRSTPRPTSCSTSCINRLPETLSLVGLGCSSFSSFFFDDGKALTVGTLERTNPTVQSWIETIRFALLDVGITILDTAPWYGHGVSETVVGWALESLHLDDGTLCREDLVINTKVGRYESKASRQFDFSRKATLASVRRSLRRLQLNYIDVLQLHDPEYSPSLNLLLDETIPALLECREKGYCRALGLTGYPLEVQYQILQATLDRFPETKVWDQSLTYGHLNLHDQSLHRGQLLNTDVSFGAFCAQNEIVVLAAAPLSMGLLSPQGPPLWHPASAALQDACRAAVDLAHSRQCDIVTLALVCALAYPGVPCTLLGMKDVAQVQTLQVIATRFANVDWSNSYKTILKHVLTEREYDTYELLQDPVLGPFAGVQTTGEYQWDGVQHVRSFWAQLPDMEADSWQWLHEPTRKPKD